MEELLQTDAGRNDPLHSESPWMQRQIRETYLRANAIAIVHGLVTRTQKKVDRIIAVRCAGRLELDVLGTKFKCPPPGKKMQQLK